MTIHPTAIGTTDTTMVTMTKTTTEDSMDNQVQWRKLFCVKPKQLRWYSSTSDLKDGAQWGPQDSWRTERHHDRSHKQEYSGSSYIEEYRWVTRSQFCAAFDQCRQQKIANWIYISVKVHCIVALILPGMTKGETPSITSMTTRRIPPETMRRFPLITSER